MQRAAWRTAGLGVIACGLVAAFTGSPGAPSPPSVAPFPSVRFATPTDVEPGDKPVAPCMTVVAPPR